MRVTRNRYIAQACNFAPEQRERSLHTQAVELEALLESQLREARRRESARARREAAPVGDGVKAKCTQVAERATAAVKGWTSRRRETKAKRRLRKPQRM